MVPKRWISAALVWLSFVSVAWAQEVQTTERAIPGQYIVVLKDDQTTRANVRPVAGDLARQSGGRITHVFENTIRGFAASMSATAAAALARNPRVRYIEQDSQRFIVETQSGATWGLDRIDQRDRPLNGTYTYETIAANVDVYVIDTGIRATHTEFGGRVSTFGFTAINDGNGTNDCNGHGTHVSGTIGGATYGVAKSVTLHAVRVLDCSGSGSTSGVIAGVDWVTANRTLPAVANMSLGGGRVDRARRCGSPVGGSWCDLRHRRGNATPMPAAHRHASPAALTVGSSTSGDVRSSFSNFGTCVDVFCARIEHHVRLNTSDTATNTISGTSMATPHVAGVAALYLANDPAATPSTVHAALVNNASVNKLSSIGAGSPNRLLYSIFGVTPIDTPPSANFTFSCGGASCTFDGTASTDDHGISRYAWDFGDGQGDTSGAVVGHTYASSGTFTVRLTVTDTANQSDSETHSVTVTTGGAPCTGCDAFSGTLSGTGDSDYHPNGSWYFSSGSGVHRGWLQGPSNMDFDLYLQKWNGFAWVIVARSESTTSQEQIAYNGTSGYYRWRVYSFRGAGSYSLWLQHP
jgi:serine protease